MTRETLFRQVAVIITALLIPLLPFVIVGEAPGDQWLSAVDDNAFAFAIVGGGLLSLDIVMPIPSSIVGTLLGARLGFWTGFAATFGGLLAGNLAGFLVVRLALARFRNWLPPFPETTTQALVFLSRPVPVLAEAIALAAGATSMPLQSFLVPAAAGNALYAAVLCGNGALLLPEALVGPGLVLPMLLPVAAWLAWRRLANNGNANS